MKTRNQNRKLLIALPVLLSLFVQAQAQDESRILDLSMKKFEWFINKQYDSLENLLGNNVRYIHSNGWVETEREVIDDLKNSKITYWDVTVSEAQVRVYGTTGVLVGKGKFHVVMGGNEITTDLLFTEVYSKDHGKWRLVSRHACKI
jgi:hypothetical protein